MTKVSAELISKALSLILRHNAGWVRVDIDRNGWASFQSVFEALSLDTRLRDGITRSMVEEVIATDDKGRFELADGRIRALSGHSFEIDIEGEPYHPDGPLWFGADSRRALEIAEKGLASSTKLRVRLVRTKKEAVAVALSRRQPGIVIRVDAQALEQAGYKFRLLSNGEVVTDHFGGRYCSIVALDDEDVRPPEP